MERQQWQLGWRSKTRSPFYKIDGVILYQPGIGGSKTNMYNDISLERLFMLCQKISDAELKQPPTKESWRKSNKT